MRVTNIDHLVLTVADIDRSVEFYTRVMGMQRVEFGAGRIALGFGEQKLQRVSRPMAGLFAKAKTSPKRFIREVRLSPAVAAWRGLRPLARPRIG